jgi:hypothetical protein
VQQQLIGNVYATATKPEDVCVTLVGLELGKHTTFQRKQEEVL